jgi:chromosome segregation ATPase
MKREMLDKLIRLICAATPDWSPTQREQCNKLIKDLRDMCPSVEELAHAAKSKIDWANQVNMGSVAKAEASSPNAAEMAKGESPRPHLELAEELHAVRQELNLCKARAVAVDDAQKELARVVGVNREIDRARDALAKELARVVQTSGTELAESKKWASRLQEELNVAIANKNDYRFEREKLAEELDAVRQELDIAHRTLASKNEELAEFKKFVEDLSEDLPSSYSAGAKIWVKCQKYGLKWRGVPQVPYYA